MERHSKDKHMARYDVIRTKDNKNNKKAFSMMQYCIIKSYAYDVTSDVIGMMS